MPEDNNLPDNQQQVPSNEKGSFSDSKDRTSEQFEKLKQSNQELKAERDQALAENKEYQSVLDSVMPDPNSIPSNVTRQNYQTPINQAPSAQSFQNLNQQQVNQAFQSMIDEDGYLDGNKLLQNLNAMDQRAKQAEERAERVERQFQQKVQQDNETIKSQTAKTLHEKYPMLDPENKEQFNPDFWEAVRDRMVSQLVHNGKEDPLVAASELAKTYYPNMFEGGDNMGKKQVARDAENKKKQINATRPRSSMNIGYFANEEEDALIAQVRQGKKGSVAELLRRRNQ